MKQSYDVVICGAGPAGSTCALALRDSGLSVALIDKSVFPRDKICGDAVAAYVPKVLNTIHPDYAKALLNFQEKEIVDTLRLIAPNQTVLDLEFGEEGFISTRVNFDNFLFQKASELNNIDVLLNTSIKSVETHENEAIVVLEDGQKIQTQMIIGCDGANGICKKFLTNDKLDKRHHAGAVRAYYKNVANIPQGTFELHFLEDFLPGYFWIFPLPNGLANVGLGMISDAISERKLNLRTEMLRAIETVPYLNKRFENAELIGDIKGFGLPLGSRKTTISGNRFMLCGDAASLIDPATGEGIGQATVSGRYAGWHAASCIRSRDFSSDKMKEYDKMVYDKLWKEHRSRYRVQKLLYNRAWLFNSAVGLANRSNLARSLVKKMVW